MPEGRQTFENALASAFIKGTANKTITSNLGFVALLELVRLGDTRFLDTRHHSLVGMLAIVASYKLPLVCPDD